MSHRQISLDSLVQVVNRMPAAFATRDVSEDASMMAAHPVLKHHSHYHAFVGKALSENRRKLMIDETRKDTARGSQWRKTAHSIQDAITPSSAHAEPLEMPLGPQCPGDSAFVKRMRLHQSWYRARVLRVPCGTGPTHRSTTEYGNMLTASDAERGLNFLAPDIARLARDRVRQGGGVVEPFRLFRNMLSSQPMCFNLFGPLALDPQYAKAVVSALVHEPLRVVNHVIFEWAPTPCAEYLGDSTAFDAFIEYTTVAGELCAIGIETKLTEPFSRQPYDGPKYRRWMKRPDSPWREDGPQVALVKHNQLWRDHLLTVALRCHPKSTYFKTRLMLVRHPEDSECERVLRGYRELLNDDDDSLVDVPLDRAVSIWEAADHSGIWRKWAEDFRTRYLALKPSAVIRVH
jgi:hypothetical protein